MSLVGDFWREQREEARNKKRLRKQNKKQKLTGEQKAYKIFGVFFALFLVFGSTLYTCRGTGNVGDITYSRIIGLNDEIITLLNQEVDTNILLPTGRINSTDYASMQAVMVDAGLDIFTEDELDIEKLDNASLTSDCTLVGKNIGAFVNKYSAISDSYITICDVNIYTDGEDIYCTSVATFSLSALFSEDRLPNIYVKNTAIFDVLDGTISSLANTGRINTLNEEDNAKVIEVLNKNLLYDFNDCVNITIANNISAFSQLIHCSIALTNNGITLKKSV